MTKAKSENDVKILPTSFPPRVLPHNNTQHPKKWEEYKNASSEEQEIFFDITVPFKNTLHRHFETDREAKKFRFDASIADNLIGNFFFDMDDSSDESEDSEDNELVENVEKRKRPTLKPAEVKWRALDVFVPETEDGSEDAVSAYTACIRNHAQLDMIVEYASLGASFRMIEKLANATRKLTGVSKYSGCSQRQVAKVLRVVCASNIVYRCFWNFWADVGLFL